MKILITTGFSGKDVGGPAQYGHELRDAFVGEGHKAGVIAYGFEKKFPIGLRHIFFFFKILPGVLWADKIIALDTFSVGLPTVLASHLFNKKIIIRIGGDFLWETYIRRTNDMVTIPEFNNFMPRINFKEKIILYFTKYLIKNSDILAFNSDWQKRIWEKSYNISLAKTRVIKNYIPIKKQGEIPTNKNFVWAGRETPVKNLTMLQDVIEKIKQNHNDVNLDLIMNESNQSVLSKVKKCYCVILPSASDVSPNFILEGASFGKPFIVTKESGINEILPRGGIFIDPLDSNDLKQAILTMLEPDSYNRYTREIEVEYKPRSWKYVAEDFLKL